MKNPAQVTPSTLLPLAVINLIVRVSIVGCATILMTANRSSALGAPLKAALTLGVEPVAVSVNVGSQETLTHRPTQDVLANKPLPELSTGINLAPQAQFEGWLVGISPDGKLALTTVSGKTYLYELSGKRLAQFLGYPSGLNGFSPDGKFILTNGGEYGSYLYDLTGKQQAHFQGYWAIFSFDSQLILVSDTQNSFLYTPAGKQLAHSRGSAGRFSPDSNFVLTQISAGNGFHLYNLSGKQLAELKGELLRYSPDGKLLLMSTSNATDLYDLAGRRLVKFQGSFGSFRPDGKFMVTNTAATSAADGYSFCRRCCINSMRKGIKYPQLRSPTLVSGYENETEAILSCSQLE